jgi:cerevisin
MPYPIPSCSYRYTYSRAHQVEYIEKDSVVHTMKSEEPKLEKNAPWGLARISHRDSLGFGTFNKYLYSENAGEGVDAYVIDTGTNIEHVDFEGRASWGKTIPVGDEDIDGNGHGTHCSGTIAGKKFGVAKKAKVYAVKVLNGRLIPTLTPSGGRRMARRRASRAQSPT